MCVEGRKAVLNVTRDVYKRACAWRRGSANKDRCAHRAKHEFRPGAVRPLQEAVTKDYMAKGKQLINAACDEKPHPSSKQQ